MRHTLIARAPFGRFLLELSYYHNQLFIEAVEPISITQYSWYGVESHDG